MLDGIVGHHGHGRMQQGSECGQCSQGDQNDLAQMFQKDLQQHERFGFMFSFALASAGQPNWLWLWIFFDFS